MTFEPIAIVRTIVKPCGPGGCDGPAITVGIFDRVTTQEFGSSTVERFDPLIDEAEWPAPLTTEQVRQFQRIQDRAGRGTRHVEIWRNRPGGAAIVKIGERREIIELLTT